MLSTKTTTYLLAALLLLFPVAAHSFWGSSNDGQSGLNLECGYDINTVTSISGRIISMQAGYDQINAQLKLETHGAFVVVILGPPRYWNEHGLSLKAGDIITVHGSKAQGKDGIVYILPQKITDTELDSSVLLRNESGLPVWAGGINGGSPGKMHNSPSQMRMQSPGRLGGGRIGGGRMGR